MTFRNTQSDDMKVILRHLSSSIGAGEILKMSTEQQALKMSNTERKKKTLL